MATDSPAKRQCAYCGKTGMPMTREHVFPAFLDKEFSKDAERMERPYWLDRLEDKMVAGEPKVKDVCNHCNNVVLSRLDSYGLDLYRRYFFRIAEEGDAVTFEYDYDLLLRWVLKLNYNSARANLGDDLQELKKLRAYMIGQKRRPKRAALYLTLVYRHELPDDVKVDAGRKGIPISKTHEPDMLRLGHYALNLPGWNPAIARTAFFQSYFFSLIIIADKEPATELERLKLLFANAWPNAVLLSYGGTKVQIRASVPSQETFKTHIWMNMPYYAREHPEIFGEAGES